MPHATKMTALAMTLALTLAAGVLAQERDSDRPDRHRSGHDRRQQFMERFDKNGDGELSDDERREGFAAMKKEHELRTYDKNEDGEVTDDERAAVRQEWEKRMADRREEYRQRALLRKYDQDKDGELNPVEKANLEADEAAEKAKLAENTKAVVKKYDADEDGKLSKAEVAAMQKKIETVLAHLREIDTFVRTQRAAGDRSLDKLEGSIRSYRYNRGGSNQATVLRSFGGPPGRGGGR
ncbi:MAG: hypothetical protein OER86_11625 [Phycisphaerae bacterium]|nr:hypothetical protein [Phycisphaerae bacterium]